MLSFIHPDHERSCPPSLEHSVRCKPAVPSSTTELQMDVRIFLHFVSLLGEIISLLPINVSLQGLHTSPSSPAVGTREIPWPMASRRSAVIKRNEGAAGVGEVDSVQSLYIKLVNETSKYLAGQTPNTLRSQESSASMTLSSLVFRIGRP